MIFGFLTELIVLAVVTFILWAWVWIVPVRVIKVKRLYVEEAKGLALPGFIFLTEDAWDDERVLRHELVHQQQMKKHTPLGVALMLGWHYGVGFVIGLIKSGRRPKFEDLYYTNPLEIEARAAMNSTEPLPRVIGWKAACD